LFDGEVEAGDDVGCSRDVFFKDLDAIEVGALCNAEGTTADYASDMGAIWERERRVSEAEKVVGYSCGLLRFGRRASIAFPGHTTREGRVLTSIDVFAGNP